MSNETPAARLERIKFTQRRVGAEDDGFWGPKSIEACQAHLRKIAGENRNKWPGTSQSALQAFYGSPGDESKLVVMTFPYPILYEGKLVRTTRVHAKCKDSLLRILTRIGDKYQADRGIFEEAEDYGGLFNNRNMRNGSSPSLHARGAAIDLDADDNGNLVNWPMVADMPIEIMEEFAREGWLCAGAFWHRDAMHFQATGGW